MDYLLEHDAVQAPWHAYTRNEFVERLGDGTLPRAAYKNYMIQDYLYLVRSSEQIRRRIKTE